MASQMDDLFKQFAKTNEIFFKTDLQKWIEVKSEEGMECMTTEYINAFYTAFVREFKRHMDLGKKNRTLFFEMYNDTTDSIYSEKSFHKLINESNYPNVKKVLDILYNDTSFELTDARIDLCTSLHLTLRNIKRDYNITIAGKTKKNNDKNNQ